MRWNFMWLNTVIAQNNGFRDLIYLAPDFQELKGLRDKW